MDEKEELISEIEAVLGLIPSQTRLILNLLVHPDVIDYTKRYIKAKDEAAKCTLFKPPWDCIKEAEARYENVSFGGVGGSDMEFDSWCVACRKRVMEE